MRRSVALFAPLLLLLVLGSVACQGDDAPAPARAAPPTELPRVAGAVGTEPKIEFPDTGPVPGLHKKVLTAGTGDAVGKGELMIVNYVGQVWKGKVFDNTFQRGEPTAFRVGAGKVIKGWDETLVGVRAGSRVLLVIPPEKGYGSEGNTRAEIKGTDTLAFVVDVVDSFGATATGDPKAVPQRVPSGGPRVTGALGQRPTVTVPKGSRPPAKPTLTILAKGSGPEVVPGLVVLQYEAVGWNGKALDSTWQNGGPDGVPVGTQRTPTFDTLVGVPVGSRVLLQLPAERGRPADNGGVAVAIDVVAQPQSAAPR